MINDCKIELPAMQEKLSLHVARTGGSLRDEIRDYARQAVRQYADKVGGVAGDEWLDQLHFLALGLIEAVRPLSPNKGEDALAALMAYARQRIQPAERANGAPCDARDIPSDTGHAEADRLIGRMTSGDPDFDDCTDAAVLIRKLVAEHKGPDGYETWKDAAIAERMKRAHPVREPWAPYLSDRADGVKGRYAVCRNNPAGYREAWNLRSHRWASASDDVLTLEQAQDLLRRIEIPSAAPTQSTQQPEIDWEDLYNKMAARFADATSYIAALDIENHNLRRAQRPDARNCTCHPGDNPPVPCARKYALNECRKAAQQPDAGEPVPVLTINGYQLRDAMEFLAPDGTDDQLEQEVSISQGSERYSDGVMEAAGLFCWLTDEPGEGSIRLDDSSPVPAPLVAQTAEGEAVGGKGETR